VCLSILCYRNLTYPVIKIILRCPVRINVISIAIRYWFEVVGKWYEVGSGT
jgi:hypothetical protein